MLILFFTIVFIAELIVVGKLISLINRARISVKEVNKQVVDTKPMISEGMLSAKNGVKTVTTGVGNLSRFVASKKKEAFKIAVKGIAALVLLLVLRKLPNKKVLTVIDVLFAIGNFLKIA